MARVQPAAVRAMRRGGEIALIDVREEGVLSEDAVAERADTMIEREGDIGFRIVVA